MKVPVEIWEKFKWMKPTPNLRDVLKGVKRGKTVLLIGSDLRSSFDKQFFHVFLVSTAIYEFHWEQFEQGKL